MILLVALLKQEISQNYIKNSKEKNVKLLVYLKTVSKAILGSKRKIRFPLNCCLMTKRKFTNFTVYGV